MNWFKTMWLTSEEREILRNAKNKQPEAVSKEDIVTAVKETLKNHTDSVYVEMTGKPYKNIFYSNKNLTVVFPDGTMLSKSGASDELFQRVKNCQTQGDIEILMIDKSVPVVQVENSAIIETPQEKELVSKNLGILLNHPDFDVQGTNVMLKGVNLVMPAPVVASFIEILEKATNAMQSGANRDVVDGYDNQYTALKMFWLKLALNTLPQSRNDLLLFIRKNNVQITGNGNLILYRRIVSKDGADKDLITYVTQQYYKLKKEGKDARQFAIYKGLDGYNLIDLNGYDPTKPGGIVPFCNLQQMYLELPTYGTNDFTSYHDRKVSIKLGGIYRIPDKEINLKNSICAAGGLHAAAVDYNYSGFGDTPVVVLVNPSKAITVPLQETGKLRTTEMFVACVNDKPQGTHFDESALSAFDNEYHDLTLEELEEAAKSKSFEGLSVQDNVPAISLIDLAKIKEMLRTRVRNVAW